jgi:hypothetical protein
MTDENVTQETTDFRAEVEKESVEFEKPVLEEQDTKPAEHDTPDKIVQNLNAALKEEREKRKKERERAEKMEETFRRFVDANTQKPIEETKREEIPDPSVDLAGHLYAKQQSLEKQLAEQIERNKQEENARQQYISQQQVLNTYRAQAMDYAKKEPGFTEAYNHLMQDRITELGYMGFQAEQAAQIAYQEEMMIVGQALSDGANPAERIHQIAKHRGFGKNIQSKQPETIMAAAEKASNTHDLSGSNPRANISLEQLAQLDGDEFEKAWNKIMKRH